MTLLQHDIIYSANNPQAIVIQMSATYERESMEKELSALLTMTYIPFILCRIEVGNWDADLTPWQAAPTFGKENFLGKADETLLSLQTDILPLLRSQYTDIPICLAGYSLAGLFALWSATQTKSFKSIAAASPSVWYPDWITFAQSHPTQADAIYLSLGDKEDRSRLPLLRGVKNCIIQQDKLFEQQGKKHILEWNEGTHFNNPDLRTARALAWCLNNIH